VDRRSASTISDEIMKAVSPDEVPPAGSLAF
jgi:hypothetical protein